MKLKGLIVILAFGLLSASVAEAQRPICRNGRCWLPARPVVPRIQERVISRYQPPTVITYQDPVVRNTIVLSPLQEQVFLQASQLEAVAKAKHEDRFDQITRATVRVTLNNVCGSGTIVGRDGQGNAIVLTNAHVAGTSRGRTVNLQRWDADGSSERGRGTIIAAGYGRGMSVDFALLRCENGFAQYVTPVPLADRYPDTNASVTTFGCPRCEWPSLQVLKMNRTEGQVLTWKPEAIGGRSGSSIIDHTKDGPRVVGLLTWAGGGEGMGQSTPFLLNAIRGKLPATIESLPPGTREVSTLQENREFAYRVPALTSGEPLSLPLLSANPQFQDDLIDSITEPRREPPPKQEPDPGVNEPAPDNGSLNRREVAELLVGGAATGAIILLLIQYGIPLVMSQIRRLRQERGKDPLLNQEQFDELVERLQELARGIAVMEARYERKEGTGK
ncbi:MAG: serine protease [Planctomycetota bacterium]